MNEGRQSILCDRYCPPIVHATTSMRVNYGSPIGLPVGLGPEEAVSSNDRDGESGNGVVFLPGTGQQVPLTFKVPPNYDIFVSRMTVQLWEIVGIAPTRTLVFVPPDDSEGTPPGPIDIRLEFRDEGLQIGLQNRPIHWSTVAGDGRRRFPLPSPLVLRGGRTYSVFARNNEAADFAISLVFWGRKRRTQLPTGGWTQDDRGIYAELMAQLQRTGHLERGWLSPDTEDVINNVGLYTCQGLDSGDGGGTVNLGAGSFDVPVVATEKTYSDSSSIYMVAQLMGRQYFDGEDRLIPGNTTSVFVEVFDERQQYWLTNVPVPHMALCGDGRQPHLLEVEWSWGYNAVVSWTITNMSGAIVNVNIDTEGWLRSTPDFC